MLEKTYCLFKEQLIFKILLTVASFFEAYSLLKKKQSIELSMVFNHFLPLLSMWNQSPSPTDAFLALCLAPSPVPITHTRLCAYHFPDYHGCRLFVLSASPLETNHIH